MTESTRTMSKGKKAQTDTVTLLSIPASSWVASNSPAVPINAKRIMAMASEGIDVHRDSQMVIDLRARSRCGEVHRIRQGEALSPK